MRIKNKALIILIAGFVFLLLISRLSLAPSNKSESLSFSKIPAVKESSDFPVLALPVSAKVQSESREPSRRTEQISLPEDIYYPVLRVVDGDTIDVGVNGKTERIRLIGINTPETVDPKKPVECFGPQASANAHKLLDGAEVKIAADPTQDDRDVYGRLLRYVWRNDGLFYNLEAIKDGFAFEYTFKIPYQYQKEFRAAQKAAMENQSGLWSSCLNNKISASTEIKTINSSTSVKCLIKGNINSNGVKIYQLPACPQYKPTVIDENKGEKWFCTETAALSAGWRKAGNCP